MSEFDAKFVINFIGAGFKVLNVRLLLILTLLLTFSLFVWAMYQPDYWRIVTATIFALAVFLPVRALEAPKGVKENASEN